MFKGSFKLLSGNGSKNLVHLDLFVRFMFGLCARIVVKQCDGGGYRLKFRAIFRWLEVEAPGKGGCGAGGDD